ncbi:MAG: peptide chain release factor 1 [Puniceicoccales bacterium]|jgi:peptide chain release factor 1|nr:peptide chain release factor 1 [Puniceicoccales bacterium]
MDDMPSVDRFLARHGALAREMAEPNFYGDGRRAAAVAREHSRLGELLEAYRRCELLKKSAAEAEAILSDSAGDEEFKSLARDELARIGEEMGPARSRLLELMVPEDPDDSRNTIMEIRAGTGGDEAALFAGELYRMYVRYAELAGFSTEILSAHGAECGGFKEVIFSVAGENVYRLLKYESGVHRVQRVPVTEANGRIHTSAATVAVLPEAEEVDVQIAPEELEITVCRASGPGGQGVNTTDSAVQILHRPTGMIVICADERSQQKNRVRAMKVLRSRLLEKRQREEREKYDSDRRSQVGSGDRSERIRTYNFPQSRLTDHRIGLTLYNLPQIMEGQLQEVLDALGRAALRERMERLFAEANGPYRSGSGVFFSQSG